MAIADEQKLDFLWKKIGYGFSKTDVNGIKAAVNESIPSPLLLRGDTIWVDSDIIPSSIPVVNIENLVDVYSDAGANVDDTVECEEDITASPRRTWRTIETDSTPIINWIPPEFGSTYQIKVYIDNPGAANPQTTGTQIFAAGSGNNDEWFFDYKSGILNFIGDNLPSQLTGSKVIYVSGANYVGEFGVKGDRAVLGNIEIENNEISALNLNGDINLIANGPEGAVQVQQSNLNVEEDFNVEGIANFNNTTDSTGATSGSVVVDGGVGIAKKLYVGDDAYFSRRLEAKHVMLYSLSVYDESVDRDILFGIEQLRDAINNNENLALGEGSLVNSALDGELNVAIGNNTGSGLTEGWFNVIIGHNSGNSLTVGSNNIIIGNYTNPSSKDANNEVTIGNELISKVRIPGVDFEIDEGKVVIGNEGTDFEENLVVNGDATVTNLFTARRIEGDIDGGSF
jgi:hypothetical protein